VPKSSSIEVRRIQTQGYVRFTRIHRQLDDRMAALFKEEGIEDITPRQANVLIILFNEGAVMSARQIADRLALSEVTVGRFVHALADAGWVTRTKSESDARTMLIRPTQKAFDTLSRFIKVSNKLLDLAFSGFSRAEMTQLGEFLEKLATNLGEELDGEAG
jgi:DNA-binding MarR family transcriptional regulator